MGKGRHITPIIRAQIVAYQDNGRSERYIASAFNISKTAAHQAIVTHEKTGSYKDRHRSGAPKKTTARDDRIIRREVNNNPFTSSVAVANVLADHGTVLSPRSVRRRLTAMDRRSYKSAEKTDVDGTDEDCAAKVGHCTQGLVSGSME